MVVVLSLSWSVCRQFGDRGADRRPVDDGLVLGEGGGQRGDGEFVHLAGVSASGFVDQGGGVGEQGVRAASQAGVVPDVVGGRRRDPLRSFT